MNGLNRQQRQVFERLNIETSQFVSRMRELEFGTTAPAQPQIDQLTPASNTKLTKALLNDALRKLDEPLSRDVQFLATAFAPTGAKSTGGRMPHAFNVDVRVGGWRLASFSGAADVRFNELCSDVEVTFAAAWWLRLLSPLVGVLVGASVPRIQGTLTGLDDRGRILLSGVAQGFHYMARKPIDGVLTGSEGFERWSIDMPSRYETQSEPTMQQDKDRFAMAQLIPSHHDVGVWFSRQTEAGVRQSLTYQGPYCNGVSYGPVVFENFPLSVGGRLRLGLDLPI